MDKLIPCSFSTHVLTAFLKLLIVRFLFFAGRLL